MPYGDRGQARDYQPIGGDGYYGWPVGTLSRLPCWISWQAAWASVESEKQIRAARDARDLGRYRFADGGMGRVVIIRLNLNGGSNGS